MGFITMAKMIHCKTCNMEIAKSAKICPACGAKNKKSFYTKWWVWAIAIVVIIGIATSQGNGSPNSTAQTANATTSSTASPGIDTKSNATKQESKEPKFGTGQYLVGKDISAGLYKVKLTDTFTKMGYVERSKDLDMSTDSILANIILSGDGYVEIKDTDVAVKLQGVEITPIDIKSLTPNLKNEVSDGIYLVGIDIKPGTYKTEVTDTTTNMGYVERAKAVSMGMNDIIANEVVQGPGYVKVLDTDFAIRVQGAKLTLQK